MAVWYSLADVVLSRLDAETAHAMAIRALKAGLLPADRRYDPPSLSVSVWGRDLPNPIGLAAGFDKNAEVPDAMLGLGFGLVEIGSVTPRPQEGNPRPRLFRLPEDRGVINRMGFPGEGLEAARSRLASRPRRGVIGVKVGANKDSTDRAADYVACSMALAPYADYLVCNVSSPNTPGLRNLQGRAQLSDLLKRPMPLTTTSTTSFRFVAISTWMASSSATRRCRGRHRCNRHGGRRQAVSRELRLRPCRPTFCGEPRNARKANSP